jgi:hypothetical protein
MTSAVMESRKLFGEIAPDWSILENDWMGRQLSWLATPGTTHTILAEGLGFIAVRTAAAVVQVFVRPVNGVFHRWPLLGNGLCFYGSYQLVNRFNFPHKVTKVFMRTADLVALHRTWECVFTATELRELSQEKRQNLFLLLKGPLALSGKALAAYLEVSDIEEDGLVFDEIWFYELLARSTLSEREYGAYSNWHESAPLETKVSREAWAFAAHVEELILLMKQEKKQSHCVEINLDDAVAKECLQGLKISKDRFEILYQKCVPGFLKTHYPSLYADLEEQIKTAAAACSEQGLFLAANALIRPHHTNRGEQIEDQLCYLYLTAFSEEVDRLFDICGSMQATRGQAEQKSFDIWVDALKNHHALKIFIEMTTFTTVKQYKRLAELQTSVKGEEDLSKTLISDLMAFLPIDDGWDVVGEDKEDSN